MNRVLAQATVDDLSNGHGPRWRVTVDGAEEGPEFRLRQQRRVYELAQETDTLAAQEGIRLFVEELEALTE